MEWVKGYFRPTELGFIVNDLLIENFSDVFNVEFTAKMEDELDQVETGQTDYLKTLQQFYDPFKKELERAGDQMASVKGVGLPSGLTCPSCGAPLNVKLGKNGHFLACTQYPECRFTSDYARNEKGLIEILRQATEEVTDKKCEKCGKPLLQKSGKYGTFLACSGFSGLQIYAIAFPERKRQTHRCALPGGRVLRRIG